MVIFVESVYNDYGVYYYVVKFLGWFKYVDVYDLLVEVFYNKVF